ENVLLANRREDAAAARKCRRHLRLERRLAQVSKAFEAAERSERREGNRAGGFVDVPGIEVEGWGGQKLGEEIVIGRVTDFESDGRTPLALAEVLLDRREQADLDFVLLNGEVAVASNTEGYARGDSEAAEK